MIVLIGWNTNISTYLAIQNLGDKLGPCGLNRGCVSCGIYMFQPYFFT